MRALCCYIIPSFGDIMDQKNLALVAIIAIVAIFLMVSFSNSADEQYYVDATYIDDYNQMQLEDLASDSNAVGQPGVPILLGVR